MKAKKINEALVDVLKGPNKDMVRDNIMKREGSIDKLQLDMTNAINDFWRGNGIEFNVPMHAKDINNILQKINNLAFSNSYLEKDLYITVTNSGIGAFKDRAWITLYGQLEDKKRIKIAILGINNTTISDVGISIYGN